MFFCGAPRQTVASPTAYARPILPGSASAVQKSAAGEMPREKQKKRRGHDRSAAYGNRKQTRYPTQKPQKKSGKSEGSERVRGGQAQKAGTRSIGQNSTSTSTSTKDGLGRAVRASRESCPTARYPLAWDEEQTQKTGGTSGVCSRESCPKARYPLHRTAGKPREKHWGVMSMPPDTAQKPR